MNERPSRYEPSSEEYARIAQGFDSATAGMIRGVGIWLRRLKWTILAVIGLVVLAYVAEDLWLRWNIRNGRQTFDSVMITRYFAIHKKSGKIEYDSDEPSAESCVNAAFPHFSRQPCWYLRRNRHPIVDR